MAVTGMQRCLLGLVICGLGFTAQPARADEISDQIEEGLGSYKSGNYGEAINALNFAVAQIQQKKAEGLTKACPKPLTGWSAAEAKSEIAGAAMFGGMTSATCGYSKLPAAAGKTPALPVDELDGMAEPATIQIQIMTDSPMLQAALMMINNPAMAGQSGGKPVKVQTYRGVQTFDAAERSGDVSLVIRSQMLVKIEGQNIDNLDDVLAYAKAVNFKILEEHAGN